MNRSKRQDKRIKSLFTYADTHGWIFWLHGWPDSLNCFFVFDYRILTCINFHSELYDYTL